MLEPRLGIARIPTLQRDQGSVQIKVIRVGAFDCFEGLAALAI
jgi:hypothetical protein